MVGVRSWQDIVIRAVYVPPIAKNRDEWGTRALGAATAILPEGPTRLWLAELELRATHDQGG